VDYIVIALSLVLALLGVYIGLFTFRKYTNLVHSVEPVSIPYIVKLAAWMGVSGCFSFFALIAILGAIAEKESSWSLQSILGLLGVSIAFGVIGFFGSLYQIYTTVKYRDFLINKKVIKKKE
jgi:hypothetical protein